MTSLRRPAIVPAVLCVVAASVLPGSLAWRRFMSAIPNSKTVPCAGDNNYCFGTLKCEAVGHKNCKPQGDRDAFGELIGNNFQSAARSLSGVDGKASTHGRTLEAEAADLNGVARWTPSTCAADSDGDKFSNGDELGDPCCEWSYGDKPFRSIGLSNPGVKRSTPKSPSCRYAGVPAAAAAARATAAGGGIELAVAAPAAGCWCRREISLTSPDGSVATIVQRQSGTAAANETVTLCVPASMVGRSVNVSVSFGNLAGTGPAVLAGQVVASAAAGAPSACATTDPARVAGTTAPPGFVKIPMLVSAGPVAVILILSIVTAVFAKAASGQCCGCARGLVLVCLSPACVCRDAGAPPRPVRVVHAAAGGASNPALTSASVEATAADKRPPAPQPRAPKAEPCPRRVLRVVCCLSRDWADEPVWNMSIGAVLAVAVIAVAAVASVVVGLNAWAQLVYAFPPSFLGRATGSALLWGMALTVALAGRNIPTVFLGVSPDRLLVIHQWVGFVTLILLLAHTVTTSLVTISMHPLGVWRTFRWDDGDEVNSGPGVVAGAALLLLGLSSTSCVRRLSYTLFVWAHVITFAASVAFTLLHLVNSESGGALFMWLSVGWLGVDTLVSLISIMVCSTRLTSASLVQDDGAPEGASVVSKLVFSRRLRGPFSRCCRTDPGQFFWLFAPSLSWTAKPITVADVVRKDDAPGKEELILYIRAPEKWSGLPGCAEATFSGSLARAVSAGTVTERVRPLFAFGPTGAPGVPFHHADVAVITAGGVGITPFMSIIRERIATPDSKRQLHLLWSVRSPALVLEMTNAWLPPSSAGLPKGTTLTIALTRKPSAKDEASLARLSGLGVTLVVGRRVAPSDWLAETFASQPTAELTLASCGPGALIQASRVAARQMAKDKQVKSVVIHEEAFGW